VKRREFIAALSGVAAWPLAAHAQQSIMRVIGLVCGRSANDSGWIVAAFHRGLSERGLVEKQNEAMEYRWADYRWERLDELIMDLVRRPVTAIAALSGSPTAIAAKARRKRSLLSSQTEAIPSNSG
jgi:putative tryptophan/tyrosine transport system substrate-binding protein